MAHRGGENGLLRPRPSYPSGGGLVLDEGSLYIITEETCL